MMNKLDVKPIAGRLHEPTPHDSAAKQVAGRAEYVDDLTEPAGTLHAYLGLSSRAHAEIVAIDLEAVRQAPGVVGVLTAADVPGVNDLSTVHKHDEPIFASGTVSYWGQSLFCVVAETRAAARRAARLAKIEYRDLAPVLSIADSVAAGGRLVTEPLTLQRGDVEAGLARAKHRARGRVTIGGQEHFYLEGQVALAVPGEDNEVTLHVSSQHPTEIQVIVAQVLDMPHAAITVNMRRMGGGFGGKESQGNLFAATAALAATKFRRAVKIRPDRDDDFQITGKRHDFVVDYDVGYDDDGRIAAVQASFAARAGWSADLSGPVTDRALFHCDNAYYYPAVRVNSLPLFTNTQSNTAFRGFGGPQGLIACERWIEHIAYALGKDPLEVRKANFYGTTDRNVTPYHQTVEDNIIHRVVEDLEQSSDYQRRRQEILAYNRTHTMLKRGIALSPVKFGISFTATWHNQAGALVHVYRDGSVHLSHGGTEMGQGLHIKVAQVVADAFGVTVAQVKINATNTGKVPNTSATAASSGTDLNGMAALDACNQIKARMAAHAAHLYEVEPGEVRWEFGGLRAGQRFVPFAELAEACWLGRVQLSAAGFYATPKIHWNRETGTGHPFYYFAYGAACAEVTIDTLTGEYQVDRADVLQDVGRSLNPAIDIGQVEGGFVQGYGWLTSEELWWDGKGQLRTHAPSTYKIPVASDAPREFNVRLAEWSVNKEAAIGRSKAVGEPPLCLGYAVVEALSMAVASVADYRVHPNLDMPVTPERVLMGVERLRREQAA
jgi:xanthine dehydrogenase large subunit